MNEDKRIYDLKTKIKQKISLKTITFQKQLMREKPIL